MATMESLTSLVNRIQRACAVLGEVKACLSGKLSSPLPLLVARGSGSENAELKRNLLIQFLLLGVLYKFPDLYICRETVFTDSSMHH
ncbi:hypothetical protein SADUNF_Sadunf08G0110600 [Salix dunnii]|uniref:Uncharacterized protein n=1 Tax=Salix dunnii TaxID=1413687 RepID=A0A835MXW1_9ROSI|nr:hypothetical protein SADUNF_Sadunf08G0110600 [Salix dunnii]